MVKSSVLIHIWRIVLAERLASTRWSRWLWYEEERWKR